MKRILVFAFLLCSIITRADIDLHKVLRAYPMLLPASQLSVDGDRIAITNSEGHSTSFEVASLMMQNNLCGTCLCMGYEPEKEDKIDYRLNQVRASAGKVDVYFYVRVILALDYQKNPYIKVSYLGQMNPKNQGDLASLTRIFKQPDLASIQTVSNQNLAQITDPEVCAKLLEQHKEPAKTYSPPALVVAPTAMNVVYRGLENPIQVAVPGVKVEDMVVHISNASVYGDLGTYLVRPGKGKECRVTVKKLVGTDTVEVGTSVFRIKNVPNPKPYFAGNTGTGNFTVQRKKLLAAQGVIAKMENFEFDIKFSVRNFMCKTTTGGRVNSFAGNGPRVTAEMKEEFKKMRSGDRIVIRNIKASGPDGSVRDLGVIKLTVIE